MKRCFLRIISGFLSIAMIICSVVNLSGVAFAENEVVENAITVTASSVSLKKGENYVEITDSTVVDNGDELALEFAWNTIDNLHLPPITFKYDLSSQLKNISIANQSIATTDATYRIEGQTLYIDIKSGSSGRSGSCSLKGTIDLSNAEVNDQGKTDIKFIGISLTPTVYVDSPSLEVSKEPVGSYTTDGVDYYQNFKITVKNKSATIDVSDATLVDKFASNDNVFADGNLLDFTIDSTVLGTKTVNDPITLPTVPANSSITITYKMKLNMDSVLKRKSGNNIARVDYFGNKKYSESWGYINVKLPEVQKSGTYNEADNSVTWTIKVYPTDFADLDAGEPIFAVYDSSETLSLDTIQAAIPGSSISGNAVLIPRNLFVKSGDAYVYSYNTTLPDSYKNQIANKEIKNKAKATITIDGAPYDFEGNGSATVPGKNINIINKEIKSVDYQTGVISWETVISLPNEPTLNSLVFEDTLNAWVNNQGYSYFDSDKEVLKSSIRVNDLPVDISIGEFDQWNINNGYFKIKFNPTFVAANLGRDIKIAYTSKFDTTVDNYVNLNYKNTSGVTVGFTDGATRSQNSEAVVMPKFKVAKVTRNVLSDITKNNSSLKNPLGWLIRLSNNSNYTYTIGDVITVTDTLPAGYRIVDGSQHLKVYGWEWNDNSYGQDVPTYSQSVNGDVQTVTFTYIVTSELQNNYLCIAFDTYMTDEYYNKFNMDNTDGVPVNIVNNAVIDVGGKDKVTVSGTQSVTPTQDKILDKSIIAQNQIVTDMGEDTNTFEAEYKILVNQDELDISEGTDVLVLSDTLGTWLDIDMSTVKVVPEISKDKISYDNTTRTIKFILEDKKAYIVTYKVKGNAAVIKKPGGSVGIDSSNTDGMYSNTAKLEGRSNNVFYNNVKLDSSTYTARATYTYNMKLTGTKTWFDSVHAYLVPKTVTIKIRQIKVTPQNVRTETEIEEQIIVKTADGSETGKWTYSLNNLIAMDNDGNRYEYKLDEVKVGGDAFDVSGYKVEYTEAEMGANKTMVIDFKNTFTAHETEIGSISVTKEWDDSNSSNRPNVKFMVTNGEGYSEVLPYNGSTVTFSNLPMYKYSRNSEDKLVRTPYVYTIAEIVDGNNYYNASYKLDGNEIAAVNGVVTLGSFSTPGSTKSVVVTNKKTETTAKPVETVATTTTTNKPVIVTPVITGAPVTVTTTNTVNTSGTDDAATTTALSSVDEGTTTTTAPKSDGDDDSTTTKSDKDDNKTTTTAAVTDVDGEVVTTSKENTKTTTAKDNEVVTTVVSEAVTVTQTVTNDEGKPVTDDKGKPVTSVVTEIVTATQTVTNDEGKPVTNDKGKPVTQVVTTVVTNDKGKPVTNDNGEKVTAVVTESVVVTSVVTKHITATTKPDDDSLIETDLEDDDIGNNNDFNYDIEEDNPLTHVAITIPMLMTIALGGVAAFAGKKRK